MARKYENVESILTVLGDGQLGGVLKRLSSMEKSVSETLKKITVLETEKAEREAEAEALRLAELAKAEAKQEPAPAPVEVEEKATITPVIVVPILVPIIMAVA